jgi:molybdopterin converting factor small subunit
MPPGPRVKVSVSSPLRDFCGGMSDVFVQAFTVRCVLEAIERTEPALYRAVCDETGRVRRHVNVFVNASHVTEHGGLDAPLAPGDVITLLPAVSGG